MIEANLQFRRESKILDAKRILKASCLPQYTGILDAHDGGRQAKRRCVYPCGSSKLCGRAGRPVFAERMAAGLFDSAAELSFASSMVLEA